MSSVNNFLNMPYVPYNIFKYLAVNNENIWKMLKYPTKDCLSKPNLTMKEKVGLLYQDIGIETDFNVFLKPLVGDELTAECTQLRINKVTTSPDDLYKATSVYAFSFLIGRTIGQVTYNGVTCPRIDVLEAELLNTLNGCNELGTIGIFQFNRQLSRNCISQLDINNGKTYFGKTIALAGQWSSLEDACG